MTVQTDVPKWYDWKCWRNEQHVIEPHPQFGWPRCAECMAAPAYWDRAKYMNEHYPLRLYVPKDDLAKVVIAKGSGVVGLPQGERVSVYFEGWLNGAMQYENLDARGKWKAGVYHAADRMITDYPTIAQASLRPEQLREIGWYFPLVQQVVLDDEKALIEWLEDK